MNYPCGHTHARTHAQTRARAHTHTHTRNVQLYKHGMHELPTLAINLSLGIERDTSHPSSTKVVNVLDLTLSSGDIYHYLYFYLEYKVNVLKREIFSIMCN